MKTRLPLILLCNTLGLILFFSWFIPNNHGGWFTLDSAIFHYFNAELIKNKIFLLFVAITNNRAFDGCSLLAMGMLFFCFWRHEGAAGRRRLIMMGVVMLLTGVLLNQLGRLIPVTRISPTLYFPNINRVSELLALPTKDSSGDSFPGDHGLMLLIFAGYMLRYFGKTAFIIAIAIFLIFALPRIMIGAHWFTDVFVGSFSVALIGLPWILLTPASDRVINKLDQLLPFKFPEK